jgi:glycosyltransferase involved in cell wall biosynthesis
MVGASVRGADQILTLSETSRDEIIRYFDLSSDAVTAIHLAPRTGLNKFGSNGIARLRETYSLPEKYCVAFSSLSAHKNISRLIEAFAEIVRDVPQSLVLLGHLPKSLSIVQKIEQAGLRDRVITTGFVPDDDVMPLISGADLFVLPSLYEGFGLPILDAQIQGVAVACSTAGSIPEVAGDGAVFFSPTSVPEIAGAMRSVLLDSKLRLELVERGTRNVARFSWKRTAEQTLAAYGRAIG